MKKEKLLAGGLAAVLLTGTAVWGLNADRTFAEEDPEKKTETEEAIEKEYPNLLSSPAEDGDMSKEETAYIVMDADGNIKDVSVSEWLRNGKGEKSIEDVSTLKDIENTANDKTFTQDGNRLTWAADGSDIKYKGTTDDEMPVKVNVSYYLDGEKMSASEIAGKSGHVEIRFTYSIKNKTEAGGYTFTTPYTMASGVLLDDEHFTDIEVDGGKVIDDGSKCICLGIAFPGLQSNLNTDISMLDIPEKVSIRAYTDNFEIDGTYSVALSGMFSDMDLSDTDSITDKVSELESALGQLESASGKLVSGASDLADGANQLLIGTGQIKDGAEQVSDGANRLSSGLSQISSNSADLNGGAEMVFVSLLATAQKQLEDNGLKPGNLTIDNYRKSLDAVIASLDKDKVYEQAQKQVTAQVEKNRSKVEAAVTDAVKKNVTEQVTDTVKAGVQEKVTAAVKAEVREQVIAKATKTMMPPDGMSVEQYEAAVQGGQITEAVQNQIDAAVEQQMSTDAVKKKISDGTDAQMGSSEVKAIIEKNINEQMANDKVKGIIANQTEAQIQKLINDNMKSDAVKAQLAKAAEGAKSVIALKASLDDYREFYYGILAYTAAVDQASGGAAELAQGAAALSSGANELQSGASMLAEGSSKLYDGMYQFNRDGIEKLVSSLSEADINGLTDRLKALSDASSKAEFIGGKSENMKGESRIIFKTESVKSKAAKAD